MTVVALLRGVNIGPHHRISMGPLREVYQAAGLSDVRTLLQSGNVVFQTKARDPERLAAPLEAAFEARFGFHSDVFLRTAEELRAVASACPFAGREGCDPAKLAVTFLAAAPDDAARARLAAIRGIAEEIHAGTRELYVYYPNGMARPQLTAAMLNKAIGRVSTTSRNWNTVRKLVELTDAGPASG
jgi:uncharacterized protein (DUF1697 family)